MRLDRARLEHSVFPYRFDMQTRFGDVDQIGHVNNVAVIALLQEGRNRFFHERRVLTDLRCDIVVAGMQVDFAGDLFHPDPVAVEVGVLEIGRSSFRLAQRIRQRDRIAVFAEVVQVARDANGPVALPEAWRATLDSLRIRPEAADPA